MIFTEVRNVIDCGMVRDSDWALIYTFHGNATGSQYCSGHWLRITESRLDLRLERVKTVPDRMYTAGNCDELG